MASSPEKIAGTPSTTFSGGCVEMEEVESEAEVVETNEEPLTRVTVCKTNENGFHLSDGRKILFSEASVTHLNQEDWAEYGLNPRLYAEGNYLMRSANLYAFLGPEFHELNERKCHLQSMRPRLTNFTFEEMLRYLTHQKIYYTLDTSPAESENPFRPPELKDPFGPKRISLHSFEERVDYDYNANDAFEQLSVSPSGEELFNTLRNYVPNLDDLIQIKITYTADGEYHTAGFDGSIPFEVETALKNLTLKYINGSFIDEQTDETE